MYAIMVENYCACKFSACNARVREEVETALGVLQLFSVSNC